MKPSEQRATARQAAKWALRNSCLYLGTILAGYISIMLLFGSWSGWPRVFPIDLLPASGYMSVVFAPMAILLGVGHTVLLLLTRGARSFDTRRRISAAAMFVLGIPISLLVARAGDGSSSLLLLAPLLGVAGWLSSYQPGREDLAGWQRAAVGVTCAASVLSLTVVLWHLIAALAGGVV